MAHCAYLKKAPQCISLGHVYTAEKGAGVCLFSSYLTDEFSGTHLSVYSYTNLRGWNYYRDRHQSYFNSMSVFYIASHLAVTL